VNSLCSPQLVCKFLSNLRYSSRIHHEFILSRIYNLPARSISTHYLFRESAFNSISFFVNSLWIPQVDRKITSNLVCSSRIHHEFFLSRIDNLLVRLHLIHYLFRKFTLNSLSSSQFHRNFIAILPSVSRIHFKFTNSLWIHSLFRESTFNSISSSFNIFTHSQIHFEFTLSSRIHFELTIFFADTLWIHFESFIYFATELSIQHLFREWTLNLLFSSRINSEFFILSRIHFEFTIFFAISL